MESTEYLEHSKAKLRPLTGRYQFMLATMLAALVATAYGIYVAVYKNGLIEDAISGDASYAYKFDEMEKFSVLQLLMMVIGITNVVAVCMFVYSVASNVFLYFNGAVNHTPGMLVGWFFIPVAHIFMPFKAMRDTSKASNAMIAGGDANAVTAAKPHSTIVIWGLLWSIHLAIGYLSMTWTFSSFSELQGMDPSEREIIVFQKTYYFQLIGGVLSILNGVALLLFASKITKEQETFRTS